MRSQDERDVHGLAFTNENFAGAAKIFRTPKIRFQEPIFREYSLFFFWRYFQKFCLKGTV